MRVGGRPFRVAGALAIAALLVNMSWLGVSVGLGSFHQSYPVSATFPKAGQNIYPGSVVDYRGVQVGKVSSIDLSNLQARFVMQIDKGFRIPTNATATLTPESFFGNEVVELNFPTRTPSTASSPTSSTAPSPCSSRSAPRTSTPSSPRATSPSRARPRRSSRDSRRASS
ncbi:MAG: MCE family protein [Actinobacteria bacterium]|nr:MAG: MCE family protein [Actinomycetota bacterium]